MHLAGRVFPGDAEKARAFPVSRGKIRRTMGLYRRKHATCDKIMSEESKRVTKRSEAIDETDRVGSSADVTSLCHGVPYDIQQVS